MYERIFCTHFMCVYWAIIDIVAFQWTILILGTRFYSAHIGHTILCVKMSVMHSVSVSRPANTYERTLHSSSNYYRKITARFSIFLALQLFKACSYFFILLFETVCRFLCLVHFRHICMFMYLYIPTVAPIPLSFKTQQMNSGNERKKFSKFNC